MTNSGGIYYNSRRSEKNETKNTVIIVLVTILIILVLALTGYIVYDKVIKKNSTEDTEYKIDNVNLENVTKKLNDNLSTFISYNYEKGKNILATADTRLLLVDYMLNGAASTFDDGMTQPFSYVSYSKYEEKYKDIYGSLDNFTSDLSLTKDTIANTEDELIPSNNISWNNTFGDVACNYNLKATGIVKDTVKDSYIINGSYTTSCVDGENSESGTFAIKYFVKDSNKHLISIVLN